MTDGNTHAIAQHLDEREDWDALQEVTAELEQAEARIEELEAELEGHKKLMLTLAGDKINLVSELAGVKDALQEVTAELEQAEARIEELEAKLSKSEALLANAVALIKFLDKNYHFVWSYTTCLKIRTTLTELTKERSDEKGETK